MAQRATYRINTVQTQPATVTDVRQERVKQTTATRRFTLELWLAGVFIVLNLLAVAGIIYTQTLVDRNNTALQNIQSEVQEQQLENATLGQQIQELMRYDRILNISIEHGLEINEENIRNVSE